MKKCGKERGQRPVSLGSGKHSACETIQIFELLAPCYLPGRDRQKPGHLMTFLQHHWLCLLLHCFVRLKVK